MRWRPVVELTFGYTIAQVNNLSAGWTDITRYVDISAGIEITRGASDELADIQPGTLRLTVDNSDGRFTPGNAASPYYPNVRLHTPIRVQVHTATQRNLMPDPSFETWAGWWSIGSAVWDISQSTTRAWHGTYSTLIEWDTGSDGAAELICYGLDIGRQYTASLYVWVPAGSPAVRLQVVGGPTGAASTTTDAWERITVTWYAGWPSVLIRVVPATATTAGQQVWVDALQVEEGAAATAWTPGDARLIGRYAGVVGSWPVTWDGLYATGQITATDAYKLLSLRPDLRPMLVEEVLTHSPLAYYPLGEPEDSTSAGDLSGTTAGPLAIQQAGTGGTLQFGAGVGPPSDGLGCPLLTPVSATAGKYLRADLGPDFEAQSSAQYIVVEAWIATSTVGRVILGVASTDSQYQLVLALDATGKLSVEWTQTGGVLTVSTAATPSLADGLTHHVVYSEADQQVWVDGVAYAVSVGGMGRLRQLSVGGYGNNRLWSGSIAHVVLYAPALASDVVTHYTTGTTANSGETAPARATRIARWAGINRVDTSGSTWPAVTGQGEGGGTPLDALRAVEAAAGGRLLASRDGTWLVLQSRDVRYNPPIGATLDYADAEPGLVVAYDDQGLVNTVTASRPGGATVRVVDDASVAAYGPYEQTLELLLTTDNEVTDAATWRVRRHAEPQPRVRELTVEASTLSVYRELLDADVSSVIQVTGLPSQAPASTATLTVEGYTERISLGQHHITYTVSPADTDSVWVLGDPVYSVLGTTTRLAY